MNVQPFKRMPWSGKKKCIEKTSLAVCSSQSSAWKPAEHSGTCNMRSACGVSYKRVSSSHDLVLPRGPTIIAPRAKFGPQARVWHLCIRWTLCWLTVSFVSHCQSQAGGERLKKAWGKCEGNTSWVKAVWHKKKTTGSQLHLKATN